MSEEEFNKLSLVGKWSHISETMNYIVSMDNAYTGGERAFDLRRRLNPHHPKEDVEYETKGFKEQQRNLRLDQVQRWGHIQRLYSSNRDELANTLDNEKFAESKSILEKVFTAEVDDALRSIIGDENV